MHLDPELRLPRLIALISWLTKPISDIYDSFMAYKDYATHELTHGSKVIYLEKYLNDRFDPDLRRIIVKGGIYQSEIAYGLYENEDGPYVCLFEYNDNEYDVYIGAYDSAYLDTGFIVEYDNTAGDLNIDINELKACIELRKLPGINYSINIIVN